MVYCGIDIGTTNAKGVVLEENGDIAAYTRIGQSLGSALEKADDSNNRWYLDFCKLMDHFYKLGVFQGKKIVCCVACQGGSFVKVDKEFNPVGAAQIWTEETAQKEVEQYLKNHSGESFYKITGWSAGEWMPVFKLKNVKCLADEKIAFVADYIYAKLTGKLVTDITSAQITGLASFQDGCWDEDILNWTGLLKDNLPVLNNNMEVLFKDVSTRWGNIDIVSSLHDQYAAMNAIDLKPGKGVMLGTGTAWVINFRSEQPIFNDSQDIHPGRDTITGFYGCIASMSSVGAGFERLIKQLGTDYLILGDHCQQIINTPMPQGSLHFDLSNVTAEGLEPLEAIFSYMLWVGSLVRNKLEKLGLLDGLEEIIMTGGAVKNNVWPKIISNLCGVKVKVVAADELTAYGASIAAANASGQQLDSNLLDTAETIVFEPEDNNKYQLWYEKYQKAILK